MDPVVTSCGIRPIVPDIPRNMLWERVTKTAGPVMASTTRLNAPLRSVDLATVPFFLASSFRLGVACSVFSPADCSDTLSPPQHLTEVVKGYVEPTLHRCY